MRALNSISEKSFSSLKVIFLILGSWFLFQSCNLSESDYNKGYKDGYQEGYNAVSKGEKNAEQHTTADPNNTYVKPTDEIRENNSSVPQKVYETLDYIKKNNRAPEGYVGGRHFGNFEQHLPERDAAGNAIEYKEYDVNPKVQGKNRGAQRLVIGDDGRAWYTNNHYKSFTEVK